MKVWGVVGWKNSGKTTVVERLVSEFSRRGTSVSTIKHSHHAFNIDHPGTDSSRHVAAGANEVLLGTATRWALLHERGLEIQDSNDELASLLSRMTPVELVIVEGFKGADIPKIEVVAPESLEDPVSARFPGVRAFACDGNAPGDLPAFKRDDVQGQADFIASELGLGS